MSKYKQDSAQWVKAHTAYQDSLKLYNTENNTRDFTEKHWDWIRFGNTEPVRDILIKAVRESPQDLSAGQVHHGGIEYGFHDGSLEKDGKYKKGEIHWTRDNKQEHITTMLKSSNIKPIGFKPILSYGEEYDSDKTYNYSPVYKKPVVEPQKPTKTTTAQNVKYDPTYENLKMRPLWANMAKQDTTSKIGTLHSLDPLYEKGFTYGEAQKFPEEIKKKYKLDYPIKFQKGGVLTFKYNTYK